MGHIGPLAATTRDLALVYDTIAGPDPADPLTMAQPPHHFLDFHKEDLTSMKIGVFWDWFNDADPVIVEVGLMDRGTAEGQTQGLSKLGLTFAQPGGCPCAHAKIRLTRQC